MHAGFRRGLGFFAMWTAIGLLSAAQTWIDGRYTNEPLPWTQASLLGLSQWYTWGVLSFPLFALARRFPFERRTWGRSLLAHLPTTLGVTLLYLAVYFSILHALGSPRLQSASMETFNLSLLTSWLITGVGHVIHQTRASRQRRETALRLEAELNSARLQLLRAQLQPHFLFNTLNSIATLMHRDVDAAERMLARLGDLLRMALDMGESAQVPLERELEFTRLYLEIQQIRFGDRLAVSYRIEPEVLDAAVPSMFLQPLAENAIRHGIDRRAEGGHVDLSAHRDGKVLHVTVRDDGAGIEKGASEERTGIGLSNLRSRLEALYGDGQRLRLQDAPGGGLEVLLQLPYRAMNEEEAAS